MKVDVQSLVCFGCMRTGHSDSYCPNVLWAAKTGDIDKYISRKAINFVVNKLDMDPPGFDKASLKLFVNKDKYNSLKGVAPKPFFGKGNWTAEERTHTATYNP